MFKKELIKKIQEKKKLFIIGRGPSSRFYKHNKKYFYWIKS